MKGSEGEYIYMRLSMKNQIFFTFFVRNLPFTKMADGGIDTINATEATSIRALVSARGSEQKTEKTKAESEIEVALASATIQNHN